MALDGLSPLANDIVDRDDPGQTVEELVKETGLSLTVVQRRLKERVAQGRVTTGHRIIRDSHGRRQRVPVYLLVEEKTS